jgi:hypothetical protein
LVANRDQSRLTETAPVTRVAICPFLNLGAWTTGQQAIWYHSAQTLEKRFMLERVIDRRTSSSRVIELAQANCAGQRGLTGNHVLGNELGRRRPPRLTLLACPA